MRFLERARIYAFAAAGMVSAFFVPRAAIAQQQAANANLERFNRQLEQLQRQTLLQADQSLTLDQRTFFDYGAYATFGYLSLDDNVGDNHGLRQYDLVGYARANFDGAHELFLRGFLTYRDFNPGDEFQQNDNGLQDPEFDRWYYRFDLSRSEAAYHGRKLDYNWIFEGGRDLVYWGNGLVLSTDLEGVQSTFSWAGNDITALAGVTPVRTTDFDSSRPSFDHNTRRGFYGVQASRDVAGHHPFLYGLLQRDYNEHDTLTRGVLVTHFDYNSYYLGGGSSGPITDRLLYSVEATYEGGTNLSNSFNGASAPPTPLPGGQTRDQIQAWAADARLDYILPDVRHTRFSGEVILASGDDDRFNSSSNTFGGNKAGTNDRAFNALGLINTSLAFAPSVSNLCAFRVGATQFPFPDGGSLRRLQLGTDLFIFNKMESDAPIDEPTTRGVRYLGWEPDFFINWQLTSDVTLVFRYGLFFPNNDAFENDDVRQYIYGGVTYAF